MMQKFDPDSIRDHLKDLPVVDRVEFYTLVEDHTIAPDYAYLKCTDEYPVGSGGLGIILPSGYPDYIFSRILFSLTGEMYLEGFQGTDRLAAVSLLQAHKAVSEVPSAGADDADFGVAVYIKGRPWGALILRHHQNGDIENLSGKLLSGASAILEDIFSLDSGSLWPRFSAGMDEWQDLYDGILEKNLLPLDMKQIHQALGDSVNLFFGDVIPGFLERLPAQLSSMEESCRRKDWKSLRMENHQIKGAAASLYITSVGNASRILEEEIERGGEAGIADAFLRLKEEIDVLKEFLGTIIRDDSHV